MFKTNSIIITSNTSKKDILCSNNNKLSYLYAIILLFTFITSINAVTLPIEVESDTVVLFNIAEEEVIYEKNPDKVQVLASLTKIMTAYTAINNVQNIKTKVTITEDDISNLEGFTVVGLEVGDVVTIPANALVFTNK